MAGNDLLGFSTTQKRNLIRYVDEQTSGASLPSATLSTKGAVRQSATQAANATPNGSDPTTTQNLANALKTDLNALLAKLKAAGIMA